MTRNSIVGCVILGLIAMGATRTALAQTPTVSGALRYFDGSWHCDGVFPSNGRKISSNLAFTWYSQTGAVLKRHDDEPPNGYHAVELWVPSAKGAFQAMIGDSSGGVRFLSSSGWVGDAITWLGDSDSTHQDQFVYTKLALNTLRIDWSFSKSGAAFVLGDTLTCVRSKA
jgi:hypothetical protein